jgi:hypothetical protein
MVFTARCIAKSTARIHKGHCCYWGHCCYCCVFVWMCLLSRCLVMDVLLLFWANCGSVFTEPLSSNCHIRHNTFSQDSYARIHVHTAVTHLNCYQICKSMLSVQNNATYRNVTFVRTYWSARHSTKPRHLCNTAWQASFAKMMSATSGTVYEIRHLQELIPHRLHLHSQRALRKRWNNGGLMILKLQN